MKYFVTSNLQLGRPGAIKLYKRPYSSVEEMNKDLISKWNELVEPNDIVYHLGNFAWDPKTAQDAITNLNGKIFFMDSNAFKAYENVVYHRYPMTSVYPNESVYLEDKTNINRWELLKNDSKIVKIQKHKQC